MFALKLFNRQVTQASINYQNRYLYFGGRIYIEPPLWNNYRNTMVLVFPAVDERSVVTAILNEKQKTGKDFLAIEHGFYRV